MLPFFIVDGARGAHGVFYDNLALGSVDLGCTIDNYHGLFRCYRAEDGDLDYYVLAGPTVPEVTRRFLLADRRTGLCATLDARLRDDVDDHRRRAGCRRAHHRLHRGLQRHGIRCDSFHFGSGYTSIGNRRYVFNWNRDKFPDPAATMARLKAAGMQPVTNIKPCLLDDHPRLDRSESQRHPGALTAKPASRRWRNSGTALASMSTSPIRKDGDWWRNGIATRCSPMA